MIQGYHPKYQHRAIITSLEFPPHLAIFLILLLMISCFRLDCIKSGSVLFCMFLTVRKAFLTAWTASSVEDL